MGGQKNIKSISNNSDHNDKPILLIGPHLSPKRSNPGGATVSYETMLDFLNQNSIIYRSINTQVHTGPISTVRNWLYVIWKYLTLIWHYEIVFINVSQNGIRYLAPFLTIIAHGLAKRIIIRPFGGHYFQLYESMNDVEQYLHRVTVLRADILFLQTHELCSAFRPIARNAVQLPTSRARPVTEFEENTSYRKRYVFVGHIKSSKGIAEILQVAKELDESYTIHLYGPILEPAYDFIRKNPDIYRGLIIDDIYEVLSKYDILLLPTYYEGEGYPGAIIEAFAMGLPVISTQWKGIPEIVEHGKTGFLVEPKSTKALKDAIIKINESNYPKLKEAARASFKRHFDSQEVGKKMLASLRTIP